jgi:predicted MFS family arabinose efflux permease
MRSGDQSVAVTLGGMFAMAGALGISRFVYTPILPVMAAALHMSKSQAGLIASANFLGYLAGALLAAIGTLPGSRKLWLLGALAVSAVSTAAMGLPDTLSAFLALRFVGGAASAFVLVLASAMVLERLTQAGRPHLSAVHFGGVGIGIVISAAAVSGGLYWGADWSQLWFIVGAIALLACPAVALLLPPEPRPVISPGSAPQASRRAGLGWLIAAYGLFGFGYVITATFLVAIVRAAPAMRDAEPLVWLVVGLAAAPSVALWSRLSSRIGGRAAYSLACVIEAIGVAASVIWPSVTGAFLAAALLGGTFMGLTALGLAEARALAPANPRPALALMTAAFGFGQIVGPVLAGFLSDRSGDFRLPSLLAVAALLAAAMIVNVRPTRGLTGP